MVFALTSRSSNETSGLRGTWSVSLDSPLMMLDSLRKFWVAQGKERQLLEIEGEVAQPQSTEGDGQNNIKPRRQSERSKLRTRHPEEIHEAHENQPYGDLGEHLCVALHFFREKQEKGNEKMKDQDDHRNDAPATVQARAIKADFFGQVPRPDDQKMREIEIRPEHDKSEQQFPEIMQMALLQHADEGFRARQQHHHSDHQRHRGDQLTRNEEKAIDGRGPVRR